MGWTCNVSSTARKGWALAGQGQVEEGIAQIRQGLAAFRATGAELHRPCVLALLAEAYGKVGQTEGGLAVLAEASAAAHRAGERWCEAELHRLKGELLLKIEDRRSRSSILDPLSLASPEECFHQAINIARRQETKSLELRAVMSLSRLLQKQGKREAARKLLAEVYGWFTEGFDTTDLKEARALLEELAGCPLGRRDTVG